MAMRDDQDPNNAPGDWWSQNAPTPSGPSWLPPGATLNPDGSVTLANGNVVAAPPPGYQRDPNTGVIARIPGSTENPDQGQLAPYQAPKATVTGTTDGGGGGGTPPPVTPPPIGVPTTGFGAAPTPYASDPNAPNYDPLPPYVAPTWEGGDYVAPTEAELLASPGYQARMDAVLRARNRSAAAQGTVLNGGTLVALGRDAQTFASNEYQNLRANTLEAYKQRYAQFSDAAGRDLASRTVNANDTQNTFLNRTATYNTGNVRSLSDYITNTTNKRNSELDYWNRLQDLNQTGANLAGGSR